ncbi:MAG: hypothetical protein OXG04_07045 [Acidobacteria bacterium]|nr:hypothetical protein [Acidobacteriota bacterium]
MDRARRVAFAAGAMAVGCLAGPAPTAQQPSRPAPETYHWVLPVDQPSVEVATLHPNDCYVVQAAEGLAFFGEPTPALRALQDQLLIPVAHPVETREEHAECTLGACVQTTRIAAALEREMTSVNRRFLRRVDHRPTPIDQWFGGAYTDVGSADRETFRRAPEQRMLFQHLFTARRGNCYEAKAPRTLTIHVRDQARRAHRTGVYHGFLYIEHHHPEIAGRATAD